MSQQLNNPQPDDGRLFLAKAGLTALVIGGILFALGVFLSHSVAGLIAFAFFVILSTAFAAYSGENRIATITGAIDVVLLLILTTIALAALSRVIR